METDPNILERSSQALEKEVRKALENRLANSMSTDVSEISWDISPYKQDEVQNNYDKKHEEEKLEADNTGKALEGSDAWMEEGEAKELGSSENSQYFYYAEEQEAKDGVMEYGE